jgi:hypothetical protein
MATFDNVVSTLANFKGYTGNPPTTEAEYLAFDCWKDSSAAPSWASVSADMALEEVRIKRQEEYPSIAELTVALYDTDDKAAIETKRAAVKAKYPKPS